MADQALLLRPENAELRRMIIDHLQRGCGSSLAPLPDPGLTDEERREGRWTEGPEPFYHQRATWLDRGWIRQV